jgi:hypothetical protein
MPAENALPGDFQDAEQLSPMQPPERRAFPHRRGLIIVLTLATAYMASHFFRASNVTIGLDLLRDRESGPKRWAR